MKHILLLFLFATVCLVQQASADSISQAFENLRRKKTRDHRMTSHIKGAICIRDGKNKGDFKKNSKKKYFLTSKSKIKVTDFDWARTRGVCYNKHGPRCSKDFLRCRYLLNFEP